MHLIKIEAFLSVNALFKFNLKCFWKNYETRLVKIKSKY